VISKLKMRVIYCSHFVVSVFQLSITNSFLTLLHFQAVPGPGKYEIKSQFSAKPPPVNQEEPIIHPPFGTQSRVRHTNALTICMYITCSCR